jgi:uncharacterized protein YndB with AHSA1/START domain
MSSTTNMVDPSPIQVEETIDATPEQVWKALTDPAEMKKWYFDVPAFRAEVGNRTQFLEGPPDKKYLHLWEVQQVEPFRRLAYSWKYDAMKGDSLVTFELAPVGNKTRVTLTHAGVESFDAAGDKNFARTSFEGGWTHIIKTSLKEHFHPTD